MKVESFVHMEMIENGHSDCLIVGKQGLTLLSFAYTCT